MKTFKHGLLALSLLASPSIFACTVDGSEGIVEKNNLWISPSVKSVNGITEAQFNKVIDDAIVVMEPYVKARGATLEVVKLWADGTVNAYAEQSGTNWKVSMFGGLARHETITTSLFVTKSVTTSPVPHFTAGKLVGPRLKVSQIILLRRNVYARSGRKMITKPSSQRWKFQLK